MTDPRYQIIVGDCISGMRTLADCSVHTCVTSPPYWGQRDYGHEGQIGLEPDPAAYIARMVDVFRDVRRVLRDDGTLWLNLGDSYSGAGPSGASYESETTKRRAAGDGKDGAFRVSKTLSARGLSYAEKKPIPPPGLKPKDLVGIPWRVALAMQSDGWYLRQDIIWHKPNPMPESVTDRCTKSHEYVFLMSKSKQYYFNAKAISEPSVYAGKCVTNLGTTKDFDPERQRTLLRGDRIVPDRRNKRSVWTVPVHPFSGAHFATFPKELIEPCVLAGCPVGGTVMDPFTGSGTTAIVALNNGCAFVGTEINPKYAEIAHARIAAEAHPILF